jgi:rubrerythrin
MNELVKELIMNLYIKQPFFWLFIIFAILSTIFYKKFRGFMGEFWVKTELNKLPKDKYMILNNVMLKTNTSTHQIDHIVISKFGIFVIEMKNYYGLITGDKYKDKWTQYLGKKKYYFNNPIHQNYGHIKALEEVLHLDKDKFISVICISNQAKVKVNDKNVVQLDNINEFIKSYENEIVDDNLNEIKDLLEKNNITDRTIKKQHVKIIKNNIKISKNNEKNMICPKCGNTLIERKGKYGDFIGCSNYPKCRYTIKK